MTKKNKARLERRLKKGIRFCCYGDAYAFAEVVATTRRPLVVDINTHGFFVRTLYKHE